MLQEVPTTCLSNDFHVKVIFGSFKIMYVTRCDIKKLTKSITLQRCGVKMVN